MISETLQEAINKQINEEFYSAYVYLGMSAYMEESNWPGFSQWMMQHYQEEMAHGMKLYQHLMDRGGKVVLESIAKPPVVSGAPLDIFQQVLEHERKVTQKIADLYELTLEQKDYASQVELQWFLTEQVEEEKTVGDIVERLKHASGNPGAIFVIEQKLASPPASQG